MSCNCVSYPQSGNPVSNIPVKIGHPLSTACERANVIGGIPQVLRFANMVLVNGVPVSGIPSNGGIENTQSFLKTRNGCYHNKNSLLASNCQ